MSRYAIIIEEGPASFGAYSPDLSGCVAAGASREETVALMRDAIEMHLSRHAGCWRDAAGALHVCGLRRRLNLGPWRWVGPTRPLRPGLSANNGFNWTVVRRCPILAEDMTPKALQAAGRRAGGVLLSREGDERLLDLAHAGSAAAFDELVARHRQPLLGYCRGFLPPDRAEDAVQVTFMRAYERLGQFHDEVAFRAWLYRVAHNVAIDSLRDRGFRHGPIDEKVEGIDRPDVMAERHERMRDVVGAIQELPDRQRDAMVLSAFEGRSYDEISGTLGVTHGATRQLLARARLTLRRAAAAVLPIGLMHRAPQPDAKSLGASRFAELVNGAGASASTMAAQISVGAVVTAGALTSAMSAGVLPGGNPDPAREPATAITAGAGDLSRSTALPSATAGGGHRPAGTPAAPATRSSPAARTGSEAPALAPTSSPGTGQSPAGHTTPATQVGGTQPGGAGTPAGTFTPPADEGAGTEGQANSPVAPVEAPPAAPNTEGQPAPDQCQPESACTPRGETGSPEPTPAPGTEGQLPAPAPGTGE